MKSKQVKNFFFEDLEEDDFIKYWKKNGFLIIKDFFSNNDCEILKNRSYELLQKANLDDHRTIFNTKNHSHSADKYFLDSGDKIRYFFEDGVFDKFGNLSVKKELAINKIGHALHDLDPLFDKFSRDKKLHKLSKLIGFKIPLLLQSMYIFKQPKIGGEVICHQDSTFLYTEPETVIGFWFALEDATIENGCMWVNAGGHIGPLRKLYIKKNGRMIMQNLDDSPFFDIDTPLEAKKGTLILLHGRLPHQSGQNISLKSRHAYTLHIIDGVADYKSTNWLQRKNNLPLRGFI